MRTVLPVSLNVTPPLLSFDPTTWGVVPLEKLVQGLVKETGKAPSPAPTSIVKVPATVAGLATAGSNAPNEYFAYDTEFSDPTNSVENSFQLIGGTGPNAPFDANGLPLFQNATGGAGGTLSAYVGSTTAGQLNYTITSLTPAPTTVSFSPLSLSFPSTAVGSISAPLVVTLKNTSVQEVSISGINLNGDQSYEFGSNCPSVLAVNASCTISVTFAPLFAGPKQATFTVVDNASASQRTVTLTGTGTIMPAPAVTLNTTSLSFANQQVGTASAARTVTLTNTGAGAVTISSIAIVGLQADDFTFVNACGSSLAVGKSCALFVTFKPIAAGAKSAAVLISDTASGSQRSVALTGTTVAVAAPVVTLSATSLNFASQQVGTASAARAVTLTNTGTAALLMSSIAIVGSQADDFILQKACGSSLPVGKSCALFVTFKPVAAGAKSASILIVDNAQGSQRSVALTGTGL
jgi:hypothetical protein